MTVTPRIAHLHGKDPAAIPGPGGSYPLLCHLLDTAVVADYLWRQWLRPDLRDQIEAALGLNTEHAARLVQLMAALHDLGKANPYFQYQERNGAADGFAADLARELNLPTTPSDVRSILNADRKHPLRRHEFLSHHAVSGHWPENNAPIRGAQWLAMLVAGHHGYWRDTVYLGEVVSGSGDRLLDGGWTDGQKELVSLVEGAVSMRISECPPLAGPGAPTAFACLSGLLTLADWIASDGTQVEIGKALFARLQGTSDDPHGAASAGNTWLVTRRVGLWAHAQACLGSTPRIDSDSYRDAVLADRAPRALQSEALELGDEPGLWVCMYPTGHGKTNAALLRQAAKPDEGFFFALPTMATTDAMEVTLVKMGERLLPTGFPLVKSHQFAHVGRVAEALPHTRGTDDDEGCDQGNPSWYRDATRRLVAHNVVGTCDQALTGALARRHIMLRLVGLANRHVVIDEVHTFDPYQTKLLIELLHWWGATATRVTLLSATLPTEHLRLMAQAYRSGATRGTPESVAVPECAYPGTLFVSSDPRLPDSDAVRTKTPLGAVSEPPASKVELALVPDRARRVAEHIRWATEAARRHPDSPVAVMVNTVADCTQIALALAADESVSATHELLCLHSSLFGAHRKAVERRLIARAGSQAHKQGFDHRLKEQRPILVVGTQIIQASLDFDVDFLSSDLAPAPDLLQRMGRQWRFEDSDARRQRQCRLGPEELRTTAVVAVGSEQDGRFVPSRNGTAPYLAAVLTRTYEALSRLLAENSGQLDILQSAQAWVDAAYNQDPQALLDEDRQIQAIEEEVDGMRRRGAAQMSKAALGTANNSGSIPLLAEARRARQGVRWMDLVAMTEQRDEEDAMSTRYLDAASLVVLAYDSSGASRYFDPEVGLLVPFPQGPEASELLCDKSVLAQHTFARRLLVPWAFRAALEAAMEMTLPARAWKLAAPSLVATRPLDLLLLPQDLQYDPLVGLVRRT